MPKKKYEFFEHTADAKFKAYGKNLEEAFANAALATTAIMTDINKIKPVTVRNMHIESKNKESLLYDFLEELLYYLDTEGFLLANVKEIHIQKAEKYSLDVVLEGDYAEKGYEVHTAIKSVTYNDMKIEEKEDEVIIQVVHDI